MRKITGLGLLAGAALLGACGDDGGGAELFPPKPECMGDGITAYQGMHPQVISHLEIGSSADGFDLDNDGKPDNKLAAVASLAKSAIDDSFKNYSIVIPIEFFDLQAAAADSCVKFAIYLGAYVTDTDGDAKKAFVEGGDCNDHDAAIHPGATEIADNLVDDDCDGMADEDAQNVASLNTTDADGDGYSPATGDCDDRVGMGESIHPGAPEICGDGLDNDCDGVADRSQDAMGNVTACSPYDPGKADINLDPLSFSPPGSMEPVITFKDGTITDEGGTLTLEAGPSLFGVSIPVTDGITLDLRISGATIKADVVDTGGAITLKNGHLGGVIDAKTADTIRGLDRRADRPAPRELAARRDVREPPRSAAGAAEGEGRGHRQVHRLPHAGHRRRRRRPRGVLRLGSERRDQGRRCLHRRRRHRGPRRRRGRRHRDDAVLGGAEERQEPVRRRDLGRAQLRDDQHQVDQAAAAVARVSATTLLLASASPRRRELLQRVGLRLEVRPADVDEQPLEGEQPAAYVRRIARAKAAATQRRPDEWVLAADTTVTLDGQILGKAEGPEEAAKMLRWLAGRAHEVITAFILVGERAGQPVIHEGLVGTEVQLVELDAGTLADYVASGEWRGKAGAYAIQGIGAALVSAVRGSVTNVIGLPLAEVLGALREAGGPMPRFASGTPA